MMVEESAEEKIVEIVNALDRFYLDENMETYKVTEEIEQILGYIPPIRERS